MPWDDNLNLSDELYDLQNLNKDQVSVNCLLASIDNKRGPVDGKCWTVPGF